MAEVRHGKTLFVRNLPYSTTNEKLEEVFSDIGPLKSCFVVAENGKCRGFGYVKFTMLEDAEKALTAVEKIDGRRVHLMYANRKEKKKSFGQPRKVKPPDGSEELGEDGASTGEAAESIKPAVKKQKKNPAPVPKKGEKQAPNPHAEGKRAKIIVRNLSFKCTKKMLTEACSECGQVVEVNIPEKNGRKMGFAFVQFSSKAEAGMAVKTINGSSICERPVAVDWALPRNKFEAKLKDQKSQAASSEKADESDEEEEMEVEEVPAEDGTSGAEMENTEEDESSDSDEEDEEEEDEESSDDNSEESSEDEDSGIEDSKDKKKIKKEDLPSDVGEGRTVFIRNLPFQASNEDVEELFSEYGDVKYARIVFDSKTGQPKGSGFVQFVSRESADTCLEAASQSRGPNSGISMSGRSLVVSLAVSRQQAQDIGKEEKKKEQKDSRNLYLAREGMIRQGTEAARDVPPADLARRMKIDAQKRLKLRDQNVFVSSTRICVHNIPATIPDTDLRKLVLKAAGDNKACVTECRIMRDQARTNAQGVGKSLGYAFCTFKQHEHALNALRHLNNNAEVFTRNKRPIVEFSLENRKALEVKQRRAEKNKLKQQQKQQAESHKSEAGAGSKKKKKRKPRPQRDSKPLDSRKEQDKVARSLHKGPLGLPSHSGPKQRHKPRAPAPGKDFSHKKQKKGHMDQRSQPKKKEKVLKPKNPRRKRSDVDSFDKLVASYKQKIMASSSF